MRGRDYIIAKYGEVYYERVKEKHRLAAEAFIPKVVQKTKKKFINPSRIWLGE